MGMSIGERIGGAIELERRSQENAAAKLRVSMPGIIEEFNAENQTATVRPAIREKIIVNGEAHMMQLPLLLDVPAVFPRAGGFYLTFPVKPGDECLVVFGDMCIDGWWQSGGVQNQMETRRHDLSDGFAILGVGSVPEAVPDYSEDSVQLRNEDNDTHVEITEDKDINIRAAKNVNVFAENVNVTAEVMAFIKAAEALIEAGLVTVDSGDIKLGAGAVEGVPKGITLKAWLDGHVHPISWTDAGGSGSSGSPSSPSPDPSGVTKTE